MNQYHQKLIVQLMRTHSDDRGLNSKSTLIIETFFGTTVQSIFKL